MHARSRKSYVYFIFREPNRFEIPPELGQSWAQTGLAHRTSRHVLDVLHVKRLLLGFGIET